MAETSKKVDEGWKEQAEREKQTTAPQQAPEAKASAGAPQVEEAAELSQARFDLFLSGLAMEAFIALGDMPHPTTRKQATNLPHAKYLIDLLGILEEKTKNNLNADEGRLLKDALYQLRMRYLQKTSS